MNNYQVLVYVRDELLANPYIDAELAWSSFNLAQTNGDMVDLYNRWMVATDKERIFIENLMKELVEIK